MKTRFSTLLNRLGMQAPASAAARIGMYLFFLAGLADGTLLPFFALWAQKDAGIPTAFIGVLLACYAGGELLATPWLGGIADRVGRKPVLLASTTGVGIGFLLLFVVHGVWLTALCLLAIGVFESALHPTIATVIIDTVPADEVRRHFSLTRVASNFGSIIGPALGALLALWSLSGVFLGCGIALLCAALLVATRLHETRPSKKDGHTSNDEDDEEEGLSGLLPAFRDRRLAGLLVWVALLEIAGSWVESVLPLYAHDAHMLSVSGVGMLFTYSAALVVVFQLLLTKVFARLSGFALVTLSGMALATGFVALLLHVGVLSLIVGVTLFAIAQMLFGPLIPTTVNQLAPPSARATYMAAVSVTNDLKDSLGPATGTFLYAIAPRLPWFLGMPLVMSAALALAHAIRKHERGENSPPSADAGQPKPTPRFSNAR